MTCLAIRNQFTESIARQHLLIYTTYPLMPDTTHVPMPNIWCVRADFGRYASHFLNGGYAGIGWIHDRDLSDIRSREELYPVYRKAHPQDTSNVVIGQQVGQIARFLLEIKPGDYILTPDTDNARLRYGVVEENPSYYFDSLQEDGCPYSHRRRVAWNPAQLQRNQFSVPFQNTMRSSLTVFSVSQQEEFLNTIGKLPAGSGKLKSEYDPYRAVLDQLLELEAEEFEILATHLLAAIGFEALTHTGKSGDGGVDASGELNVAGMAKVKISVQVKRYKPDRPISANTVKALRQSIPNGEQGAFITTTFFQKKAYEIASEPGFNYIGLVNGRQLVDLLVEHWEDIPEDFRQKLGLKRGLVPA